MTKEQQFDEELVAKIIAAAEAHGVVVRLGNWGVWPQEREASARVDGPFCAVGAGCLYRGIEIAHNPEVSAVGLFSQIHGVSATYAQGVSDGFETFDGVQDFAGWHDYARGVAVGEAVRAYFFTDVP